MVPAKWRTSSRWIFNINFYRSRGDNGEVFLNQHSDFESLIIIGLFCCEVPNAVDINQTLCVVIGNAIFSS